MCVSYVAGLLAQDFVKYQETSSSSLQQINSMVESPNSNPDTLGSNLDCAH